LGDAVWAFDLSGVPNTDFVKALKRGRFRFLTNQ
jgi:hypothetical protein